MTEAADSLENFCAAYGAEVETGCLEAGNIVGDWRLTAFIGRGGSGEVYCAEHVRLGTPAAVKVLVREDEHAKARFEREAKLLSELKADAFPRFLAYGETNGHAYLAMELLEPGDLPADDRSVAKFLLRVCEGVAELHERGIVHRDIKPGNILRRNGEPVIADLGLVKIVAAPAEVGAVAGAESLTVVDGRRACVGTPVYGAPEQMERGEASVTSDVHALGVLADCCFGGKPPNAWARIVRRATSSIPGHRYQSVALFARAIRRRHWMRNAAVGLCGLVSVAMAIGAVCIWKDDIRSLSRDWKRRGVIPVLDACAFLDGKKARGVRWFLDYKPVEMPYRFAEVDRQGDLRNYRWLHAVTTRDGKSYSAKAMNISPNWKGRKKMSFDLHEDPAAGTPVRVWSPDGVPFDFVWCPPGENTISRVDGGKTLTARVSVGCGYWMAKHKLTGRQLGAIVKSKLIIMPLGSTRQDDCSSDKPVSNGYLGSLTVPTFSFAGTGMVFEPPDVMQWEHAARAGGREGPNALGMCGVYAGEPEWAVVPAYSLTHLHDGAYAGGWMRLGGEGANGNGRFESRKASPSADDIVRLLNGLPAPVYGHFRIIPAETTAGIRFSATSGFAVETNAVLFSTAQGLLRSDRPEDVVRGEEMLKEFRSSDDALLSNLAKKCCRERGVLN